MYFTSDILNPFLSFWKLFLFYVSYQYRTPNLCFTCIIRDTQLSDLELGIQKHWGFSPFAWALQINPQGCSRFSASVIQFLDSPWITMLRLMTIQCRMASCSPNTQGNAYAFLHSFLVEWFIQMHYLAFLEDPQEITYE